MAAGEMMTPQLLTKNIWPTLTSLAKREKASCAVPYFGTGGSKLLPLRRGSRLVIKFDRGSVTSGQVNPKDIIRLIRRGVEVHACSNLHAKVFAFGRLAIVGSANVSTLSATTLLEACVKIRGSGFAKDCKTFVQSLSGDVVGLEFAESMLKLYRPPKRVGVRAKKSKRRIVPQHSELWLVALTECEWDQEDFEQQEKGWTRAESRLTNQNRFEVETFLWSGKGLPEKLMKGARVLMNTRVDKSKCLISPPGRVLDIRSYRKGRQRKAIIYLEIEKHRRRRRHSSFLKSLGAAAKALGNPRRTKQLRSPDLVYKIDQVFS
jgi:hypothetical protein